MVEDHDKFQASMNVELAESRKLTRSQASAGIEFGDAWVNQNRKQAELIRRIAAKLVNVETGCPHA